MSSRNMLVRVKIEQENWVFMSAYGPGELCRYGHMAYGPGEFQNSGVS